MSGSSSGCSTGSRGLLRRMAAGGALLLAGSVLSACSGSEDPADDPNGGGSRTPEASGLVAIITPSPDDAFFAAQADAAAARAQELGYDTSVESHDDDPDKQSELIDDAISARAVAIVLDNAGADASIGPVQKAVDAGVPVVLIDRELNADDIATAQIVSDNAQGARLGAQAFVQAMGEEGTYVELTGPASDPNAGIRSDGYRDVISQYPDMELVARETANWDEQEALTAMARLIRRDPNIAGVIAGNDTMALGAVAALQAANLTDVVVVGFDGSPEAIAAIDEGAMHASVLQPAVRIAELAVEQAHEVITTGDAAEPERQSVDCELITAENADDYGVFGPA
jgi:erythritol transport system substrate-binding protein